MTTTEQIFWAVTLCIVGLGYLLHVRIAIARIEPDEFDRATFRRAYRRFGLAFAVIAVLPFLWAAAFEWIGGRISSGLWTLNGVSMGFSPVVVAVALIQWFTSSPGYAVTRSLDPRPLESHHRWDLRGSKRGASLVPRGAQPSGSKRLELVCIVANSIFLAGAYWSVLHHAPLRESGQAHFVLLAAGIGTLGWMVLVLQSVFQNAELRQALSEPLPPGGSAELESAYKEAREYRELTRSRSLLAMSATVWGWILLHLTVPMDGRTRLAYALLAGGVLYIYSFRTAYLAHSKDSANRRQFKSLSYDAQVAG
jgi:hypothetical protein